MIEHRLFAIYKNEPASVQVLQNIVEQLCPYFNPPLDRTQIGDLVEKTKNKINRIRVELVRQGTVVKTNTGFILAADQPTEDESVESQRTRILAQLFKEYEPCISYNAASFLAKQTLYSLSILSEQAARSAAGQSTFDWPSP